MPVSVDDLDRCSLGAVAQVIEAINRPPGRPSAARLLLPAALLRAAPAADAVLAWSLAGPAGDLTPCVWST